MDDATYYAWWDRISAAQTVEALDAVVRELDASVAERDRDVEDLIHVAAQTHRVLVAIGWRPTP